MTTGKCALDGVIPTTGASRGRMPTTVESRSFEAAMTRTAEQTDRYTCAGPMTSGGDLATTQHRQWSRSVDAMGVEPRRKDRDRSDAPTPTPEAHCRETAPTHTIDNSRDQVGIWGPQRLMNLVPPPDMAMDLAAPTQAPDQTIARSFQAAPIRDDALARSSVPPLAEPVRGYSISQRETHFPPARFAAREFAPAKPEASAHARFGNDTERPPLAQSGAAARPFARADRLAGSHPAVSAMAERPASTPAAPLDLAATQVLTAIIDHCRSSDQSAPDALASSSTPFESVNAAQPLRLIKLQLSPASLGMVDIQVTLKQDALGVHLDAESASTTVSLEQDRTELIRHLEASGYLSIDVHITQATPQAGNGASRDHDTPANTTSSNSSERGSNQTPREGRRAHDERNARPSDTDSPESRDHHLLSASDRGSKGSGTSPYATGRALRLV